MPSKFELLRLCSLLNAKAIPFLKVPTKEQLEKQIFACVKERVSKGIKINWQFDITAARNKMNRHYEKLNQDNVKFKLI